MKRLLTIEYYKNLNYKPFQIFSALYFVILIALLFIGLVDIQLSEGFQINLKDQGIYNFPGIWNFTTWIVAILKIFLGFILVFSICQEFTNRMFKQNTIDGLSRKEFLFSKLLTITTFTFVSTLVVFGITLAIGYTYSESTEIANVTTEIALIANYFLKLFTFFCFLLFLSVLLRKSIFVFITFFLYWIFEGISIGLEKFLYAKSVGKKLEIAVKDKSFFLEYLPLESMSRVIPNPLLRLKSAQILGSPPKYEYPTDHVIACIIWATLFIIGSYVILKKRDW